MRYIRKYLAQQIVTDEEIKIKRCNQLKIMSFPMETESMNLEPDLPGFIAYLRQILVM